MFNYETINKLPISDFQQVFFTLYTCLCEVY